MSGLVRLDQSREPVRMGAAIGIGEDENLSTARCAARFLAACGSRRLGDCSNNTSVTAVRPDDGCHPQESC